MIPSSFDLTIPEDWSTLTPTPGTVALVAEPDSATQPFRCAVSVLFEDLDDQDVELLPYARARIRALADVLTDVLIVDQQPATLAGVEAIVSTIGYRQGRSALTLREWIAVVGGAGVLVGAVCPNDRFAAMQATLDEIAGSLVLETGG